jgi:hypothetical protein
MNTTNGGLSGYLLFLGCISVGARHGQRHHGLQKKTHGQQCTYKQEDTEERLPIAV